MANELKELLLQDYQHRSEEMWKSETAGETRVNLFIGLITLSVGAIGALISKDSQLAEDSRLIIVIAFVSLFCVGLVTFMRMIVRNKNTDLCKHQLDLIRRTYQDQFDDDGSWVNYDLFPKRKKRKGVEKGKDGEETKDEKKTEDGEENHRVQAREFGGLTHTVAVLNSLLCAGAIAALVFPLFKDRLLLADTMVLVFGVTLWSQLCYQRCKEAKSKKDMQCKFPEDTHAGGVVYTVKDGVAHYLMVSSKDSPKTDKTEWVLPKGHIEPGESPTQAALREVCEEAGIVARPVGLLGRIQFTMVDKKQDMNKKEGFSVKSYLREKLCGIPPQENPQEKKKRVSAKFYLMEKLWDIHPREKRLKEWVSFEKALDMLAHPESRALVYTAEQRRLRQLHKPKPAPEPIIAAGKEG